MQHATGTWATRFALAAIALIVGGMLLSFAVPAYAADKGGAGPSIAAQTQPQFLGIPGTEPAPGPWTGLYLGGYVGYGVAVGELSQHGESLVDGLSARGLIGGVDAMGLWQVAGTPWVPGIRAGYTWSDMRFEAGGGDLTVSLRDSWYVDGVLGYAMGNTLPYVHGGYVETDTRVNVDGVNAPTLRGWRAGGGVLMKGAGTNLVWGPEYTYSRYDDVSIGDYCPIGIDPEDHRIVLRGLVRFGGAN